MKHWRFFRISAGLTSLLLLVGFLIGFFFYLQNQPELTSGFRRPWRSYLDGELKDLIMTPFMRVRTNTVEITGTPGTPVLVGIRLDRDHGTTYQGILPTNYPVRFKHEMSCTVKNLGDTGAEIMVQCDGTGSGSPFLVQYYGTTHAIRARPSRSVMQSGYGWFVRPVDWPQSLPPGLTEEQATTIDFTNEYHKTILRVKQELLAKNQDDPNGLYGSAVHSGALGRKADQLFYYEKFMQTACSDPGWLNGAAYAYVELGGTNLDLAYATAVRAQGGQHNRAVQDTVGWILLKRGDYEKALPLLDQTLNTDFPLEAAYHKGVALYMLMREEAAGKVLKQTIRLGRRTPEAAEAKKLLKILGLSARTPEPKSVALVRARLAEEAQDPVALCRLARMYEGRPTSERDWLVNKALGFAAFRGEDYPKAMQYFTESLKERTDDAHVFFFLGMAQERMGNHAESQDALRKAISLPLKPARVDEARRLLAPSNPPVEESAKQGKGGLSITGESPGIERSGYHLRPEIVGAKSTIAR